MEMDFAKQIELVFQDGKKSGTHKFAFIRGILDYGLEKQVSDAEDLSIPLTYIAIKHIEYFWKLYVHNLVKQSTRGNISYYKDIEKIALSLISPPKKSDKFKDHQIYELIDQLFSRKLPKATVSGINGIRSTISTMPATYCKNITTGKDTENLDFYHISGTYQATKGSTIKELIEKDPLSIVIPKVHLKSLNTHKSLLYYTTKLHWAMLTDEYTGVVKSGLRFLEDIDPERKSLEIHLNLYRTLGIKNCTYCNKKADTVDHIYPFRLSRRDDFWNLVPACRSCNSKKSDKLLKMDSKALDLLQKYINFVCEEKRELFIGQINYKASVDGKDLENFTDKELSSYLLKDTISKVGVEGITLEK